MNKHSSAVRWAAFSLSVAAVTVLSTQAQAQIPSGGFEEITTDLWDFMIENVGLMVVGLGVIGGLIGLMIGDASRGAIKVIICLVIGAMLGAAPAAAEYVMSLGGASGTLGI